MQSTKIETQLVSAGIKTNKLLIFCKPKGRTYDFRENLIFRLDRHDRKELKSIVEDNWQIVGDYGIENAWFIVKYGNQTSENSIIATAKIKSNNISSGIIQAIQLAKLELSSQLEAKIATLSKLDLDPVPDKHDLSIQKPFRNHPLRPFL